uniref:ALMS_motif domain-containing protein n=1 Tax=Glossina austeni TaxID=7395 RepID=A0A1A9UMG9_GLOAU
MDPNVPRMVSHGMCTTSQQKIDNYSQTTLIRAPQIIDREIQVNLSSSSSTPDEIEFPSSFEYSKAKPIQPLAAPHAKANLQTTSNRRNEPQHDFVVHLTDPVQRKILMEKNGQHSNNLPNMQKLQDKLLHTLEGNKENTSQASTRSSSNSSPDSQDAPELDLGVQLICSLVNAKSVTQIEKKQLVREIIKRIMYLSVGGDLSTSGDDNFFASRSSISVASSTGQFQRAKATNTVYDISSHSSTNVPGNGKPISVHGYESLPRVSKTKKLVSTNPDKKVEVLKAAQSTKERVSTSKSASTTITESSTETLNTYEYNGKNSAKREKGGSDIELSKNLGEHKIRRSSEQLKTGNVRRNSQLDSAYPNMREWLDPMTQAEVTYERKQRNEQLHWIEKEIHRLECLKQLLLHQNSSPIESSTTSDSIDDHLKRKVAAEAQHSSENVYDSVDTEIYASTEAKSDKPPKITEKNKIHDIEIIIEESNEDVVNLNDNLKRTRERRKETQLIYKKSLNDEAATEQSSFKPRFRSTRETITINEEQLLGDNDDNDGKNRHRKKMETPTLTRKINEDNNSLRDLVLQRKEKFIELYKNKRHHPYETVGEHKQMHKLPRPQFTSGSPLPSSYSRKSSHLGEEVPSTTASKLTHVIYTSAAVHTSSQQLKKTEQQDTTTTTTTSSVSLFCISSDMSVPISSENSSSTPVTGARIQTTGTMLRSFPIYGPQCYECLHTKRLACTHWTKTCPSITSAQIKPKGIAYVIEFDDNGKPDDVDKEQEPSETSAGLRQSTTTYVTNNIKSISKDKLEHQTTLQEHLENSHPNFLRRSKEREDLLKARQTVRVERQRQLKQIIDNASFHSLEERIKRLPPAPIEKLRVVNTKEMKALTSKRFAKLPEVVEKRRREREERDRRNNRIVRHLFNQRLQQRVLGGKTSLSHCKTVI